MLTVHVAVGVIQNSQGDICVAKRPDGKHLAGYWEFPGGKVEAGEDVLQALKRELHEELAIDVHHSEALIKIQHRYPDKQVLLDVHWVRDYSGEAVGKENQEVRWVARDALADYRFPEANVEIVRAILDDG